MKKIKTGFCLLAALCAANLALAQAQVNIDPNPPRWHSDKGYWVIESNVKTPDQSLVRFFNADQQLIYTEKVSGVVLDCSKRKTLMKLKRALEKVVDNHQADGTVKNGTELTASFMPKKKVI